MSLTLRGKMKTIAWRWRASHHWFSGRRDFTDSHLWLVLYAVSIASSSKTFIRWSFNNIRFKLSLTMISSCENTLGISLRWIYRCWTSFRRGCRMGVEFPIIDAQCRRLHTRTDNGICLSATSVGLLFSEMLAWAFSRKLLDSAFQFLFSHHASVSIAGFTFKNERKRSPETKGKNSFILTTEMGVHQSRNICRPKRTQPAIDR